MPCVREPQAGLPVVPIFTGACLAFLAARFSLSDFPGFLPESFCGDLLATLELLYVLFTPAAFRLRV